MATTMDMDIPPGQGDAIKGVQNVKEHTFKQDRHAAARRRKEKERKKKKPPEESTDSRGREDHPRDSREVNAEDKGSKVRGALLDVII